MKRSQPSIKGYLISKGLMEMEPDPIYENQILLITLIPNFKDLTILSFLFLAINLTF